MTKPDWRSRHQLARLAPQTPNEHRVVVLLDALTISIAISKQIGKTFPDSNTSEAYGSIITGIGRLLLEKLDGLDAGSIDDELREIGESVSWSVDDEEVVWT